MVVKSSDIKDNGLSPNAFTTLGAFFMKIGFDAKRAFVNYTGLGNYSRNLLSSLFAFYPAHHYTLFSPKQAKHPQAQTWRTQPNVSIITPDFATSIQGSMWRSLRMGNQIQAENIQVFHGLSHELPYNIDKANCKKIVTIHDLIFLRYPEAYSWFDRQMHLLKVKHACKHADVIIAISQQTKQDLIEFLHVPAEKIQVVYQTCHAQFRQLSIENKKTPPDFLTTPYILYVGSLAFRKNVTTLIQAFEIVCQTYKEPISLVIVGKGPLKQALEKEAHQRNIAHKVHFLDSITDEALPQLYQSAKAFVYPSLFEGFGIPIIEALYAGVPVVTGNNSCFEEAGGKGAIYVNQTQATAIAEGIFQILTSPSFSQQLVIQGFVHVQQFSPENMAKGTLSCYLG